MQIDRRTLTYLIVFIVFFVDIAATIFYYWDTVYVSATSIDTVLLSSPIPDIAPHQEYGFLRSPAATILSGLCMLKLMSMLFSKK